MNADVNAAARDVTERVPGSHSYPIATVCQGARVPIRAGRRSECMYPITAGAWDGESATVPVAERGSPIGFRPGREVVVERERIREERIEELMTEHRTS